MANVQRSIGLSLGADLCWPICYEQILERLRPAIPMGDDVVRFTVERVPIEPFDLWRPCPYDVVLDRISYWYPPRREWLKKAALLDDVYLLNNVWAVQTIEKTTAFSALRRLGLPTPRTWLLPPKAYAPRQDLQTTLERYARLFDLDAIAEELGYPLFLKPYDGGAWVDVSEVHDAAELHRAYDRSGTRLMLLQKAVTGWDLFVRAIGVGPQVDPVRYDPRAPLHARYLVEESSTDRAELQALSDLTLTINSFFGWDFNSCEALRVNGVFHAIDFTNPYPDSQVTALHYHFPWLVKALLRWTLFCAATRRRMRHQLDWRPYFEVARRGLPLAERLRAYGKIAKERFESDRFAEFCDRHLPHLDEVAWEFFGTPLAREVVRRKVASLYPAHEIEAFTEYFWELIQLWRHHNAAHRSPPPPVDATGSIPTC